MRSMFLSEPVSQCLDCTHVNRRLVTWPPQSSTPGGLFSENVTASIAEVSRRPSILAKTRRQGLKRVDEHRQVVNGTETNRQEKLPMLRAEHEDEVTATTKAPQTHGFNEEFCTPSWILPYAFIPSGDPNELATWERLEAPYAGCPADSATKSCKTTKEIL